eukprot:8193798-Pyramimonas_sp.AAC.1
MQAIAIAEIFKSFNAKEAYKHADTEMGDRKVKLSYSLNPLPSMRLAQATAKLGAQEAPPPHIQILKITEAMGLVLLEQKAETP